MTRARHVVAAGAIGAALGFAAGSRPWQATPSASPLPALPSPQSPGAARALDETVLRAQVIDPPRSAPAASRAPVESLGDTVTIEWPAELWRAFVAGSERPEGDGPNLNGLPHGPWTVPTTATGWAGYRWSGEFVLGRRHGTWKFIAPNGRVFAYGEYAGGTPIPPWWQLQSTQDDAPEIFVETPPPAKPGQTTATDDAR